MVRLNRRVGILGGGACSTRRKTLAGESMSMLEERGVLRRPPCLGEGGVGPMLGVLQGLHLRNVKWIRGGEKRR